MRTISQILIEADCNNGDLKKLTTLWNEIKFSAFERKDCETDFAREYLLKLIVDAAKKQSGTLIINYCGE